MCDEFPVSPRRQFCKFLFCLILYIRVLYDISIYQIDIESELNIDYEYLIELTLINIENRYGTYILPKFNVNFQILNYTLINVMENLKFESVLRGTYLVVFFDVCA